MLFYREFLNYVWDRGLIHGGPDMRRPRNRPRSRGGLKMRFKSALLTIFGAILFLAPAAKAWDYDDYYYYSPPVQQYYYYDYGYPRYYAAPRYYYPHRYYYGPRYYYPYHHGYHFHFRHHW
jgi:hypothetical protein